MPDPSEYRESSAFPEVFLWRAVIWQALSDATGTAYERNYIRPQRVIDKARAWLTRGGRDFRMVCDLAELEPDLVRAIARERLAGPPQSQKRWDAYNPRFHKKRSANECQWRRP